MYMREVTRMTVEDLVSVVSSVQEWFKIASDGHEPQEELARERLYLALKPILAGPTLAGMGSAHDPSGSAQRDWEDRRDRLVRDVALAFPWEEADPCKAAHAGRPWAQAYLRGGPMVARQHECEAWTEALRNVGLDWVDIELRAWTLHPNLPAEDRQAVDAIVQFLMRRPSERDWRGPLSPKRTARNLGVSWEALLRKSRFLSARKQE